MTEVTRVPLQPIAKGSLPKLWIGVLVAILLGAGLAWMAVPKGFAVETLQAGEGDFAKDGDMVFMSYKGSIAATGEVFQESPDAQIPIEGIFPDGMPFPVSPGETIPGFYKGMQQMQEGGKYKLYIPAEDGYGATPPPESMIPANADLIFEIEVFGIMSREEFDRKLMILQQAMQAAVPAGPDGPAGPEPLPGQ